MARPKGGLGRGLESLFADTGSTGGEQPGEVTTLPLGELEPDPSQPRKTFREETLSQLAKSIEENGLLQPIAVRPTLSGRYTIIAGERRWRAARMAGMTQVPVIIREVTDQQAMELALIENLQREDLDPMEQAEGFQQLLTRCGLTQEQAAQRLGISRSSLANSLRLLSLPENVRQMVKEGKLSTGHCKVILGLPSPDLMETAAALVAEGQLNVRQTEALVKKLQKAPKPPKPQTLRQESSLPTEVEASLREVTGSEIKVKYKQGKGTLTLHFYSDEQLRQFANLLGNYQKEN